MGRKFKDNALTTLASSLTALGQTLTVATGKGDNFPAVTGAGTPGSALDYFVVTLEDASGNREKIKVEARTAGADVLGSVGFPLVRGYDGTSARAWAAGDSVDLRLERAGVQESEDRTAQGNGHAFGNKPSTTAALNYGYYGGVVVSGGAFTTIADGTVAMTSSSTNYVERTAAGAVSANTSGFTAGRLPMAIVVTDGSKITSITDRRPVDSLAESIFVAKGDIIVASGAGAGARKAVGSNGQIIVADSAQSDGLIWTDYTRDALNVNPNFLIDQINEGSLYTVSGATNVRGPDGVSGDATGAGVFKMRRTTDPDNAAKQCLEITCTTADASIGSTDRYAVYWGVEGYDMSDLASGTASASKLTAMFRIKSNVTGTFGVSFQNAAANRRYIGTINIADTNEHDYAVTLTLDTSGTWNYTNGGGAYVYLALAAGSNFQATAGAWGAGAEITTSAQANFMSSNTNAMYIKKAHFIPGGVALAFANANIERELAKAQRYFEKSYSQGTAVGTTTANGTVRAYQNFTSLATGYTGLRTTFYRASKRVLPTVISYSHGTGNSGVVWDGQSGSDVSANLGGGSTESFDNNGSSTATSTVVDIYYHWTSNARLS